MARGTCTRRINNLCNLNKMSRGSCYYGRSLHCFGLILSLLLPNSKVLVLTEDSSRIHHLIYNVVFFLFGRSISKNKIRTEPKLFIIVLIINKHEKEIMKNKTYLLLNRLLLNFL
jgi:hypothetical protein